MKDILGELGRGHPDEVHHEQQQQPEDDPLRPRQDLGARRGRHLPHSLILSKIRETVAKIGKCLIALEEALLEGSSWERWETP